MKANLTSDHFEALKRASIFGFNMPTGIPRWCRIWTASRGYILSPAAWRALEHGKSL